MKGELRRKIMKIFAELKPIVIKIELKPIENKTSQLLTGEEILQSDQSRIIQQAKFIYSPLRKAFKKQIKTIEEQGKKQIDAITNQIKKLEALTNKDNDHKDKEIFNVLVTEIFDKIVESTDEINQMT